LSAGAPQLLFAERHHGEDVSGTILRPAKPRTAYSAPLSAHRNRSATCCSPLWTGVNIWPARLDRRVECRACIPGRRVSSMQHGNAAMPKRAATAGLVTSALTP
jgi:hypothetical protein